MFVLKIVGQKCIRVTLQQARQLFPSLPQQIHTWLG